MSRTAYINGAYVPQHEAVTHIEDRGYQFADGVYEYIAFYNGRFLDLDAHLARLWSSLEKLRIAPPMSPAALRIVIAELVARNRRTDGGLYLQISRGVARRDHAFPAGTKPVLSMTVCAPKTPKAHELKEGVRVISRPDIRWGRCDIKSLALLPNILAKQDVAEAKAREAWLILTDGTVTEGSASNAFIVTGGTLRTHPADHHILPGITRDIVLRLAREHGIPAEERAFTLAEAKAAQEGFITSTSPNVLPVTRIDDTVLGDGAPGPVTQRLMALYFAHILALTGRNFA
jgi:D-alanine transaminase